MGGIRAVVWDFDGVLVDTEMADCVAWRQEFAAAGTPITVATYAGYWSAWALHRRQPMIARLMAAAVYPVERARVEARRRARYEELCADLPARPGIAAWLTRAPELGLRCVVATNDESGRTAQHLGRLGLAGLIEHIITPQGRRAARKPAPDLYLHALAVLGLPARDAIAVEDSPHGVAAAKAAGLRVVAVPNQVSEHVDLGEADQIITDPAAIPLEAILRDGPSTGGHQPSHKDGFRRATDTEAEA